LKKASKRMAILFLALFCNILISTVYATDGGLTRQQMCKFIIDSLIQKNIINSYERIESPFRDTNDFYVKKAYMLGFVKGDEHGNYNPDRIVSNQEAAVIFKRVQDYVVPRIIYDTTKIKNITDKDEIRSYALPSVSLISSVDLVGDGSFNPTKPVNLEMATQIINKIYANKDKPVSKAGFLSSKKPPVLMYHEIGNIKDTKSPYTDLFVSPQDFEAQIKYLSDNKYTFLFPEELNYADSCDKSVVITIDDGYDNNYTEAFRILKKYNAKATIFVIADFINTPGYLSKDQINDMAQSGLVSIGSHSMTHLDLSILDSVKLEYEMKESKELLESIIGKTVTSISYPFGNYTKQSLETAKIYYRVGFSVQQGTTDDPFTIKRVVIPKDCSMDTFIKRLTTYH